MSLDIKQMVKARTFSTSNACNAVEFAKRKPNCALIFGLGLVFWYETGYNIWQNEI